MKKLSRKSFHARNMIILYFRKWWHDHTVMMMWSHHYDDMITLLWWYDHTIMMIWRQDLPHFLKVKQYWKYLWMMWYEVVWKWEESWIVQNWLISENRICCQHNTYWFGAYYGNIYLYFSSNKVIFLSPQPSPQYM